MEQVPHLVEVHKRYAEKGLVILAISRHGEEPGAVEQYARRRHSPFAVFVDLTGEAGKQFADKQGHLPVPTSVLLDRDHRVVLHDVGFSLEKFAKLEEAIKVTLTPIDNPQGPRKINRE